MSKTRFLGGRRTKIAAAVFAVIAIAGCASLGLGGGFQQPVVNFKDLKVRGLGLSGGSLDAYLNVYNPNGYRLDATRLTYTGIGSAAQRMMQSGSVPYTVTGDVTVTTPVGNFTVPYSGTGRFSAFGGAQNN